MALWTAARQTKDILNRGSRHRDRDVTVTVVISSFLSLQLLVVAVVYYHPLGCFGVYSRLQPNSPGFWLAG